MKPDQLVDEGDASGAGIGVPILGDEGDADPGMNLVPVFRGLGAGTREQDSFALPIGSVGVHLEQLQGVRSPVGSESFLRGHEECSLVPQTTKSDH